MATDVEIANQALLRVGAESITSGEWNTPSNERSRVVKNSWPFVRREVLRCHPWNAVTFRRKLLAENTLHAQITPSWDFANAFILPTDCLRVLEADTDLQWRVERAPTAKSGSVSYLSAYPQVVGDFVRIITSGAHGMSTGEVCVIDKATQTGIANTQLLATVINTTTLEFREIDPTGFTAGAVGGGNLTPLTESLAIVADTEGPVGVRYIADVTDPSDFDSMLTEALVLRLAVEIVERVTDSTRKREALMVEYQEFLREVKHVEGQEQSPSEFEEDLWISSRY